MAWGLSNGQFTPAALAALAKKYGMHAVALEFDDFNNSTRWAAFRTGIAAAGLKPGVWMTMAGNVRWTPPDAQFVVAEMESDDDYAGLAQAIETKSVPNIPRAILTNFGGLIIKGADGVTNIPASRAKAKPLIDAGWQLQTECYLGDDPNMTPDNQAFIGCNQLGWSVAYPCFGTYGTAGWGDYSPWHGVSGRSVYLAEYLK